MSIKRRKVFNEKNIPIPNKKYLYSEVIQETVDSANYIASKFMSSLYLEKTLKLDVEAIFLYHFLKESDFKKNPKLINEVKRRFKRIYKEIHNL